MSDSKYQIALIGGSGRMGRAIITVLSSSSKSTLSSSVVSGGSVFLGNGLRTTFRNQTERS